jgi:hypothetical protein
VIFQVLKAIRMKMIVFCVVALISKRLEGATTQKRPSFHYVLLAEGLLSNLFVIC